MPKPKEPKTRLQFDFSPEQMSLMEELKVRMDASSKAEVMRLALRLLDKATSGKLRVVGLDGALLKLDVI